MRGFNRQAPSGDPVMFQLYLAVELKGGVVGHLCGEERRSGTNNECESRGHTTRDCDQSELSVDELRVLLRVLGLLHQKSPFSGVNGGKRKVV